MKEYWKNTLVALKGKIRERDFIGFDVETYGENNEFYSGSFYYYKNEEDRKKGLGTFNYFTNKEEMLIFITQRKFRNKFVVATNLGFDLTSLFWKTKYWNNLNIISRGSDILLAKYDLKNNNGYINFIDTFNFCRFGVADLGKMIGIDKLEKPLFLGNKPMNYIEEQELKNYNIRDSKISCDFMYFLQKGINEAGGNLKITIASTSLDVWRRGFLNNSGVDRLTKEEFVLRNDKEVKNTIFSGYYGGRTEVFSRGRFNNINYYDINSLYPSVMRLKFPVPQSIKKINNFNVDYINNFEGVTECLISSPNIKIPLLPVKIKEKGTNKLVFPTGTFKGTWNNVELRKALRIGYKIKEISKQYIYTQTFYPFKYYVEHFYNKRLEQKILGNNMEFIYKLLLNSLYGKFAQKKRQKMNIKFVNELNEEEKKNLYYGDIDKDTDVINNILYEVKKSEFNGIFSFPILSSYTTSYARLLMYDYLEELGENVIYMDTDSIFTSKELSTSNELGFMKLEYSVDELVVVKPKFYMIDDSPKIKGINRCTKEDFVNVLSGGVVDKIKFSKLRESIRRGIEPNKKIKVSKKLDLNDTKRDWENKRFDDMSIQESIPLVVEYLDDENRVITRFDVNINPGILLPKVNEYIKRNQYLKTHFKGRMLELKDAMVKCLINYVDLDVVDWLVMSKDKPISEYLEEFMSVEGV